MRRNLIFAFLICFATTAGFAQSGFNGKWATDRLTGPRPMGERREIVQLDIFVEDGKASGSIALGGLGGSFDTFKDGKINGNKLQFRTVVVNREGIAASTNWQLELVDENTVTIARERFGPRFPLVGANLLELFALSPGVQPAPPVQIPASTEPSLLKGLVQDSSKAFIPGVTVTVTNVETGASFRTTTGETGQYSFPGLKPGKYWLSATFPGFEPKAVLDLNIGDTPTTRDFTLEVTNGQPIFSMDPLATLHRVPSSR
jgi:hypothetical protein